MTDKEFEEFQEQICQRIRNYIDVEAERQNLNFSDWADVYLVAAFALIRKVGYEVPKDFHRNLIAAVEHMAPKAAREGIADQPLYTEIRELTKEDLKHLSEPSMKRRM